jgi:hypothetical protein
MIEITAEGEEVMFGRVPLTHTLPVEREVLERLAWAGPFAPSAATKPPAQEKVTKPNKPDPKALSEPNGPEDFEPSFDELRTSAASTKTRIESPPAEKSTAAKEPRPPTSAAPKTSFAANGDDTLPEYYWTWRVLTAGFTPAEAARVRGLNAIQLREHLREAARFGYQVEMDWLE